ncbi:divergent polysaccharide deacetylase family protein [Roseovarius sp. LXJ103]|nr:divergent polysaccharide deacetylase family protein [Roseovarius carneus]PWE37162.1 hypothetical protein DD563_01635 [Pelagicola sp. LXJ1103]
MLAGTVVSSVALGVVSVMAPPPDRGTPASALPKVPAGSGFAQGRDDTPAELPDLQSDPTEIGQAAPVTAPEPDALVLDAGGTAPTAQPDVGDTQADLSAPDAALDSGIVLQEESPALAAPEMAEQGTEENLSISAEPTQPALPQAEAEVFPTVEEVPEAVAPAEAEIAESEIMENAKPPEAEGIEAEGAEAETTEETETAEIVTPEAESAEEEIAVLIPEALETPEQEPARQENASTIGNLAEDVQTGRLPAVGDPEPEAEPAAQSDTADAAPRPAIEAFAAPFDNPEGKPLMGIVLIDDGTSPIGVDALASFPYPLTFAVDAAAPGAREAMQSYRDKGFEVMALADLPQGAQAVDTEVTMQTVLTAVPEAVAVLEGTTTGLQAGRDVSEQLASILNASGHGLVLFSNGLDTAQKLISREGVPVGAVFRDFDANGQDAKVIRRFLDQAAFKASRDEGGVIMLGRLRADTISALLLWGLQDRASSVALAPISAVLTAGAE